MFILCGRGRFSLFREKTPCFFRGKSYHTLMVMSIFSGGLPSLDGVMVMCQNRTEGGERNDADVVEEQTWL